MFHLSCRVGMGAIRELLDGKIWEWDLSFRREWEWDGNDIIEMGGNWYKKSVPAHLYCKREKRYEIRDAILTCARVGVDRSASSTALL